MEGTFGAELRRWRDVRRVSQLELAASAEVSQRHISFLETGRARPSREMVLHLAETLELPLRSRNRLLGFAGFAPGYPERALDDVALGEIRQVLQRLLDAQPYPAYVVDRLWNIQLANDVARALIAAVAPEEFAPDVIAGNAMRLLLHPHGLRDAVANWPSAASALVRRLARDAAERPDDGQLEALLEEARRHLGTSDCGGAAEPDDLLVPLALRRDDGVHRFYTTIATIGAAHDVTLEELRIETLVPADDGAGALLRAISPRPGAS
jgi:transcriptional regulator with XRE-family HTH domain